MEKLAAYLSRLSDLIPGVDTTDSQLTADGGVGTDVVTIGSGFVALFCTHRGSYTAHRNAAICDRIRPAIALTLPEAVAAADDVVVFKAIPGLPLERHWLVRQTESSQERLAAQLGGFLRELHAIPVPTLENLKLPDHSTTLDHFRQQYGRIQQVAFPEMHPSAVAWARDQIEAFLGSPRLCERSTFQHADLVPWHILVDRDVIRLTGMLDFGSGGIGDPAVDLSNILLAYGESFVARVARAYPESQEFLDRARFLTGLMYLRWICNGIQANERKWFMHHLICARDLLPPRQ